MKTKLMSIIIGVVLIVSTGSLVYATKKPYILPSDDSASLESTLNNSGNLQNQIPANDSTPTAVKKFWSDDDEDDDDEDERSGTTTTTTPTTSVSPPIPPPGTNVDTVTFNTQPTGTVSVAPIPVQPVSRRSAAQRTAALTERRDPFQSGLGGAFYRPSVRPAVGRAGRAADLVRL